MVKKVSILSSFSLNAQSRTCTLREAIIVGSLISKTSIPVLHASAAMLKIAEMDYSGI